MDVSAVRRLLIADLKRDRSRCRREGQMCSLRWSMASQVTRALDELNAISGGRIPGQIRDKAEAALVAAKKWAADQPKNGGAPPRSYSSYFDLKHKKYKDYRWDIQVHYGQQLTKP